MILAVVQARMGSTRLKGKVLREVLGKPLIGWLLERLKLSKRVDRIVVATSVEPANEPLQRYVESLGISVFRGSEDDVLDRFYQAALAFRPDTVVRITADCPLIDPEIVDRVIGLHLSSGADYTATAADRPGFPDGLDTEAFGFEVLEAAWKRAKQKSEREHVTPYIRQSPEFRKNWLRPDADGSDERWTVDREEDFLLVKNILEHFASAGRGFGMGDILAYKAARPDLFEVNRHIRRNEGTVL